MVQVDADGDGRGGWARGRETGNDSGKVIGRDYHHAVASVMSVLASNVTSVAVASDAT